MTIREAPNPRSGGVGSDGNSHSANLESAVSTPAGGYLDDRGWPLSAHQKWEADQALMAGRAVPRVSPPPRAPLFRRPSPIPTEVNVRRSRRVVRHVDLWSVFRFSLLLYATFLIVSTVSSIVLWVVAVNAGAITSLERFIDATLVVKNFHLQAIPIFFGILGMGIVLVCLATGVNVLVATVYNLISDVVGGIELTVIEEEPVQAVV